jgi:hypothetical protein
MTTTRRKPDVPDRRPARWPVFLLLGFSVVLSLVGLLTVAVLVLFAPFHWLADDGADVDTPASRVRAAALPVVADVTIDRDWFDGDTLFITLVPSATDEQARAIWCELVLPTGVDPSFVTVGLDEPVGDWDAPADCSHQSDVPNFWSWPA